METNNKTTQGDAKTSEGGNKKEPESILGGFDVNSFLTNTNLMELLKHLLTGGAAMAGNYFLWIKPMQDKMEAMTKQINDQEKRIEQLEKEREKIKESLENEKENISDVKINLNELFVTPKRNLSARNNRQAFVRI